MFLNITLFLVVLLLLSLQYIQIKDSFTEDPLFVIHVTRSPLDINIINPAEAQLLQGVDHISQGISCKDCNASIMSAYEMIHGGPRRKLLAVLPNEKTFVFIKQRNFEIEETLNDIFKTKKSIGYNGDIQRNVIIAIAASMGYKDINLVEVDGEQLDVYAMCYFETIEENPIRFNGSFPQVLDLGEFSVDSLRALIPFALIRNKDFSKYVVGYQDRFSIKTCVAFQKVVVGDEAFDEIKFAPHIGELRRKLKTGPEVLEYYNMLAARVEGFLDVFEPQHNIDGFYDSHLKTFYLVGPEAHKIEGLPLEKLIHVQLTKQVKPEENGFYKVADKRYLQRLSDAAPIKDDPAAYVCVGHPTMINKEQCMRAGGIWDRPCTANEECPFYQKNMNYRNYRGGCIDGACEMPLGVERVAFRQYKNNGMICNGCPIGNPLCCDQQEQPDYAFPLDYFERTSHVT
jgi:hypothetical protein